VGEFWAFTNHGKPEGTRVPLATYRVHLRQNA
jgi:hypothetical protein